MLCQFTVKNFRCVRDELTLDMQAASISEHEKSLLTDKDGAKFLPVSVLYGPNGGGKSTVFMALNSLICKVLKPICATVRMDKECVERCQPTNIAPFKFDNKTVAQPTEFEIFFRTEATEYRYQLHIFKEKVIFESLYRKKIEGYRYAEVFTRKGSGSIVMKGSLRDYSASGLTDNLPLLSYLGIARQRNHLIKDVINWFDHKISVRNYGSPRMDARVVIMKSKDARELMLRMFEEMDIDIVDFRVEERNGDGITVYTTHSVKDKNHELELLDESSGTIKLFGILPYIVVGLLNGETLIVDELDAKLHPALLKYIISLYTDPAINKKNAQLLFTSHDLSTMSGDFFRRDEIWFVAKDNDQASKMYSLIEFRDENGKITRKDASYNKQYLEGKYGADPYLRRIINWEEC